MGLFQSLFGKRVPKTNIKQRFDLIEQVGKGTMSTVLRRGLEEDSRVPPA